MSNRGLYCTDGNRGQFMRGVNVCAMCGRLAWQHFGTPGDRR